MSRVKISSLANGSVVYSTGAPAPGVQASVYQHGTGTPVTVYADEASGTTLPQPLTADLNGQLPGWVTANQVSDIVVSGAIAPAWPSDGSTLAGVSGGTGTQVASPSGAVVNTGAIFQNSAGASGRCWLLPQPTWS